MNALPVSAPVLPTPTPATSSRPAGKVSALNPAPPVYACIPAALRVLSFWTLWQYGKEPRSNGKFPKEPVSDAGRTVSISAPANWRTFAAVSEQQQARPSCGIGFCITPANGVIGLDIDACRNKETGELTPAAAALVRRLPSYWEVSPSGEGLRCFLRGTLPDNHACRAGNVEVYSRARFLTVTGNHLPDTPANVCELSEPLAAWYAETFPARPAAPAPSEPRNSGNVTITDADLLDRARNSHKDGQQFRALYDDGRADAYAADDSRADLALCGMLAYWTGKDAARVDSLFRKSALMREKWDAKHGAKTYGERTIAAALNGCKSAYGERVGQVNTQVNTGGGVSEPQAAPALATAPRLLPAVLDRLEQQLKQRGMTSANGLPLLPPNLDYTDGLDIARCLDKAEQHLKTLLRYLWARWYDALPTRRGAKDAILRELFPALDGLHARHKAQEFNKWLNIARRCPADAWNDFARPWTFFEDLSRLHNRPNLQSKYLACTPYKGMRADMQADARTEQTQGQDAPGDPARPVGASCDMSLNLRHNKQERAAANVETPPHLCTPIHADITGDSISLDIPAADALDFADLANEAAAAGLTPGAYLREMKRELLHLRRLLNADPMRTPAPDMSEISDITARPAPDAADVEPLPDAFLFPAAREFQHSEQDAPAVESSSSPPPMQAETVTRPAVTLAPPAMPLDPHRTPVQDAPAPPAPDTRTAPPAAVLRELLRLLPEGKPMLPGPLIFAMEKQNADADAVEHALAFLVQQGTVQHHADSRARAHLDTYQRAARC